MIKKGFWFLLLFLIAEEALAGIFTVIPTDRSQIYLGMVFGGSVGAISLGGGTNNPTLGLMFQQFNFIIVSIGAIVLSYLGISSTINTAREGEALGRKISLWVPLRAFTGMLLMVPGPTSGYSMVQMTVVWIVLNGIGAANSVWNIVLGQLAQNVSAIGGVSIQLSPNNLNNVSQNVLNASTCMYALNNAMPLRAIALFQTYGPIQIYKIAHAPIPAPGATLNNNPPNQITQTTNMVIGLQGAPPPYDTLCGYFTVTTSLNKGDPINTFNYATLQERLSIKVEALNAMFNSLAPAAQILANPAPSGPQTSMPDPGYIYQAGESYINQISKLATGIRVTASNTANSWEKNGPASTNPLTSNLQAMQSYGWIHAGSYYYTMVQATTASRDPETMPGSAILPAGHLIPTQTTLSGPNNMPAGGNGWPTTDQNYNTALTNLLANGANQVCSDLNYSLQKALNYWNTDSQNSTPSNQGIVGNAPSTGNQFMDAIVNGINTAIRNPILNYIQSITTGNGSGTDPLVSLGQFGATLMLSAEIAIFSALVTSIILSLALSTGSCVSPLAWGINLILVQLVPLIYGIMIMMWTAGATLGVYIPLVPYLIFTTSAFGWIIAVVEAVVGAPLIALGLVHPSGEELGKITNGLNILANIFLRPTLMIFGFVLGGTLLRAGIALINFGFVPAVSESTIPSIFSILAILMMYMFLIMALVNKSFSLIYQLPNQIMKWMGGQAEGGEPSEMIQQAKGGFDSGAGKVQEMGGEIHKGATEKMGHAAMGEEGRESAGVQSKYRASKKPVDLP